MFQGSPYNAYTLQLHTQVTLSKSTFRNCYKPIICSIIQHGFLSVFSIVGKIMLCSNFPYRYRLLLTQHNINLGELSTEFFIAFFPTFRKVFDRYKYFVGGYNGLFCKRGASIHPLGGKPWILYTSFHEIQYETTGTVEKEENFKAVIWYLPDHYLYGKARNNCFWVQ